MPIKLQQYYIQLGTGDRCFASDGIDYGCVARHRPDVVMVVGIGAFRDAYRAPKAKRGLQPERLAGVPVWVVGNPSGLNAHETVDSLAESYREVWDSVAASAPTARERR